MLAGQWTLLGEANGEEFSRISLLDEIRLRQCLQDPFALTNQFGVASGDVIPTLVGEANWDSSA